MPPSKGRGRSPCSPKGIVGWTCVALADVQDPYEFLLVIVVIVEDVMADCRKLENLPCLCEGFDRPGDPRLCYRDGYRTYHLILR